MKSMTALWKALAEDLGELAGVDTRRDFQTVAVRTEREGISFLTITLPNFGQDFIRALDEGRVAPTHFAGFRRSGGLPLFLGGFLEQVFRPGDGLLLDNYSRDAILAVRQLCGAFGKISLPTTPKRERQAFESYVETDIAVGKHRVSDEDALAFLRMSRRLFGRVFSRLDDSIARFELTPRHGPGATADRLLGNQKFELREWTTRLDSVFPVGDYLLPNLSFREELDDVRFLSPGDERPSRVISVPKTLKTPRIIAIEPACVQYAQQAVAGPLVEFLESDYIAKRFVGFSDQVPNQVLAQRGSEGGSLATLDLSEASDRVSNELVKVLVRGYTHLSDAVFAARSETADVSGHGIIPLSKYASMGSALTFPIEAMVFATIVFIGIERSRGRTINSFSDFLLLDGSVRVYGDDIIVPVDCAPVVVETLEAFGFKVNSHKSFWTGRFRESCGKEYFDGHDVSIVKFRRVLPANRQDVPEILSLVSTRNQFYKLGLRGMAEYLDRTCESVLGHFPYVGPEFFGSDPNFSGLGRLHDWKRSVDRFCPRRHVPLVRAWLPQYRYRPIGLDGSGALLKFFLKQGDEPYADRNHLERSGRPAGVSLKLRWLPTVA